MTPVLTTTPYYHPFLGTVAPLAGALAPRRPRWTPRELATLTDRIVTAAPGTLRQLVRHDPAERWYARLALTDEVEVWLIGWAPGQATEPHDHGGAAGALTVLAGTLTETYRDGHRPVRQHAVPAGRSSAFGPSRIHTVGNAGDVDATSVQAYSPPLLGMGRADLEPPR